MYKQKALILNCSGLHARPVAEFTNCALKFKSRIEIARCGEEEDSVNAQSMVLILTLGLCKGDEAVISANGPDEVEAVDTLVTLIRSGFGEL